MNGIEINITASNILMSFVASCFLAGANLHAQFTAPQIDCKIMGLSHPAGASVIPAVFEVSNGESIQFQIGLKTTNLDDPVAPSGINPNPIPPNGQYFLLKVIRKSDGAEMPIKIIHIGGGKDLNYLTLNDYLEIPEAKEVRRAKAAAAWNKVKAVSKDANHWGIKDADMVDALEQQLVENQLGHFTIICSYVSNKPGTWNGQVSSAPIEINVVDKGTSLDKLAHP